MLSNSSVRFLVALTGVVAGCASDGAVPEVAPFCGQQPLDEQGPTLEIVVVLDTGPPSAGRLLVRVDPVDHPDGFQFLEAGPGASGAALRVEADGSGFGCASTVADTIYFDVRGEAMHKGWLRAKSGRPARVHVRQGLAEEIVGPELRVGTSAVMEWDPTGGAQ